MEQPMDVRNHAPFCGTCHRPLSAETGSHAHFGDFAYHFECLPHCVICGRSVDPDGETEWHMRTQVFATANGYAQLPVAFTCPDCGGGTLRDEAAGQE